MLTLTKLTDAAALIGIPGNLIPSKWMHGAN